MHLLNIFQTLQQSHIYYLYTDTESLELHCTTTHEDSWHSPEIETLGSLNKASVTVLVLANQQTLILDFVVVVETVPQNTKQCQVKL